MNKLAIIIPAYKIDYFEDTLYSISQQTNKNFTVYIGIDASPYDFETVINKYIHKIDIHYTRFEKNLGGKDLVAQWKRCIDLIAEEEWIWLFSDDDIMQPQCVDNFYSTLQSSQNSGMCCFLYHFDVIVIDGSAKKIKVSNHYPDLISSYDFYNLKMQNRIDSFVVENIFSKKRYEDVGGFVNFDCAWGADTASWVMFMGEYPMQTIKGESKVLWRQSDKNISPDNNYNMVLRKIRATMNYFDWCIDYFALYKQNSVKRKSLKYIIQRLSYYKQYVSMKEIRDNSYFVMTKHYSCLNLIFFLIRLISKIKTYVGS